MGITIDDLNYMDYIKFMEKQELLEEVGSSDDLVELLLNPTVCVLQEQFKRLGLDREVLIDVAYEVVRSVEDKFKYYSDCMAAEGFQAAMFELLETNSDVASVLVNKIKTEE